MVDYDKSTGNSGTMRIRDTGTYVEFWITSGNSTTYNYDMPWRYNVNGVLSSWREYRYEAGSGFELLGRWNVTTNQTVTFYLGDTGTSGLGGPTTHSVSIKRATVPQAPDPVILDTITSTSMRARFSGNGNGGAPILEWQLGYGTSGSTVQHYLTSTGTSTVTGLTPGTRYYFWARGRNSEGWGPWSARRDATTHRVPDAPSAVETSSPTQTSIWTVFADNGDGGTPIIESQIGYNTNNSGPVSFVTANGGVSRQITGLSPGLRYYFWARSRNAVGWGPWAGPSNGKLIAGAHVKVGTEWREAVPYVNVNGVWKLARPWVRIAGVWKETT